MAAEGQETSPLFYATLQNVNSDKCRMIDNYQLVNFTPPHRCNSAVYLETADSLIHLLFPLKLSRFFFFQFQRGELAIYNRVTTVNLTAVNTSMNTTYNYHVELEQNGGMTVVGDNANINNYHQPPQN